MKRFSKLAVVAVWVAAIWLAAPVSAWAGPASDQGENANTSSASHASGKGAHNYWLGRDIGRLALLLPSRKVEETTRR